MGFTGRIKLFGHRVPNKNDTDAGVFDGHQEDLFSRSPGLSLWVFSLFSCVCVCVWTEEDVHVGRGRRIGKLVSPLCPLRRLRNLLSTG